MMSASNPADVVLLRSLHRAVRALRPPRPTLWNGIFSGVVRRTQKSQTLANLQSQATSVDVTTAFRAGGAAAITLPALGMLKRTAPTASGGSSTDTAFAALKHLNLLDAALARLEADGAFEPMRRSPAIQYTVGQRLEHATLGPCLVYGWDPECRASDPRTADELERAGGEEGIVDNRRAYVGIDSGVSREQPYYRVQLREGRGHYAAQEHLRPVPREEAFRVPIQGTSFFFVRADEQSGFLVPRGELAAHYPEDALLLAGLS